jgi:GTP-binding protein
MLETWEEMPPWFISSAKTGEGQNQILKYIDNINKSTRKL